MALVPIYTFTQNDGGLTGTIDNETVYGSPNPDRDDAAEFILWSKTDKKGNRVFHNPEQGNVLTNLQYTVNTNVSDGWYEVIRERIQLYNAGTNYVEQQSSGGEITQYASVFYYPTTGLVYYAVAPSTGQDPTNQAYFAQVIDLSTILDNTNIDVYYKDIYVDYHQNACITKKFANSCNCSGNEIKAIDTLYHRKVAADLAFSNDAPEQMEEISVKINETCVQC
jgi:hypothetical protein